MVRSKTQSLSFVPVHPVVSSRVPGSASVACIVWIGHFIVSDLSYGAALSEPEYFFVFLGGDNPSNRTVLQQHVDFWDEDKDGIIYPLDTYRYT